LSDADGDALRPGELPTNADAMCGSAVSDADADGNAHVADAYAPTVNRCPTAPCLRWARGRWGAGA